MAQSKDRICDVAAIPIKLDVLIKQYWRKDGSQFELGCVTTNMPALKAFLAKKGSTHFY